MNAVARGFLGAALFYGIVGLLIGLQMAMSHDHGQMPVHAHINVIGWVSFFLFAIFYQTFGAQVSTLLARIHFWLAQVSMAALAIGLWLIYSGQTQYEPIAAISSLAYAASFVVFAMAALPCLVKKSEATGILPTGKVS